MLAQFSQRTLLAIAWGQAIVALIGSLIFSQILDMAPCVLCLWQRGFMYPLVVILPYAIISKKRVALWLGLLLSLAGAVVAFYQVLLEHGVITEQLINCKISVPCTTKYINWLGFITIPLLSLLAFGLIAGILILVLRQKGEK